MAHRWKNDMTPADVTPKSLFLNRRQLIAGTAGLGAIAMAGGAQAQDAMTPNTLEEITTYNNFYEFGTGKSDPANNAEAMVIDPWTVTVDGLVDNPGDYSLADLTESLTIEERTYRFRCVEAWSMVVPWQGFELADLLAKVGVQGDAKYVAFETVVQPENMPGVRSRVIDFPYVEGLRLDEAMHPLTMMATGLYGEPLPKQSGAPLRLVVPWKYGFKSIKSIVKISLVAEQPEATWNNINPREYGFYSNVNPGVDHPRWSQATERRIGGGLFASRQDTLMFNGYDEVASLYGGMDLSKEF
jgi:sulfoxide reductase catalytic subunit YedY